MKAVAQHNNRILASSEACAIVEGNYYFPRNDVKTEYLTESDTQYTCPWKGECTYYNIVVADVTVADGAWSYGNPKKDAEHIKGFVAFAPQITIKTEQ